ncbi:hypothetical protein BDY21DRAFT_364619 [Lineolata rhizophorae]|uniref:Uncharacterized protein n=1 Tax=Lineolata rhizophorae TaxID=578093 RepID=A0A6A6NY63_9PEZI|nr:hypothetical protein BDY21DRAFT_364619 [Lineolata rhizophorae]
MTCTIKLRLACPGSGRDNSVQPRSRNKQDECADDWAGVARGRKSDRGGLGAGLGWAVRLLRGAGFSTRPGAAGGKQQHDAVESKRMGERAWSAKGGGTTAAAKRERQKTEKEECIYTSPVSSDGAVARLQITGFDFYLQGPRGGRVALPFQLARRPRSQFTVPPGHQRRKMLPLGNKLVDKFAGRGHQSTSSPVRGSAELAEAVASALFPSKDSGRPQRIPTLPRTAHDAGGKQDMPSLAQNSSILLGVPSEILRHI